MKPSTSPLSNECVVMTNQDFHCINQNVHLAFIRNGLGGCARACSLLLRNWYTKTRSTHMVTVGIDCTSEGASTGASGYSITSDDCCTVGLSDAITCRDPTELCLATRLCTIKEVHRNSSLVGRVTIAWCSIDCTAILDAALCVPIFGIHHLKRHSSTEVMSLQGIGHRLKLACSLRQQQKIKLTNVKLIGKKWPALSWCGTLVRIKPAQRPGATGECCSKLRIPWICDATAITSSVLRRSGCAIADTFHDTTVIDVGRKKILDTYSIGEHVLGICS